MAAHKWAAEIHAFADGREIQGRPLGGGEWRTVVDPNFGYTNWEFRIKPAEPERAPYPLTQLSWDKLEEAYRESDANRYESFVDVANFALRHAIDAGQIVTREEFDRMCGDRKARDMVVAISVAKCVARQGGRYSYDDLAEAIAGAQR